MFGDLVALYLFLGGAGGGLAALVALLGRWSAAKPVLGSALGRGAGLGTAGWGYLAACGLLCLGALCLLLDLGRPERFHLVLTSPSFSLLSLGSFLLTGAAALSGLLAAVCAFRPSWVPRPMMSVVEVAMVLFGIGVLSYTGFFFADIDFVALWNNPGLPPLFMASSASAGAALLLGLVLLQSGGRVTALARRVAAIDTVAVLGELAALTLYVGWAAVSGSLSTLVAYAWRDRALLMVGAVVGLGLVAPLVLEFAGRRLRSASLLALVVPCVLVGAFALRYGVVNVPLA